MDDANTLTVDNTVIMEVNSSTCEEWFYSIGVNFLQLIPGNADLIMLVEDLEDAVDDLLFRSEWPARDKALTLLEKITVHAEGANLEEHNIAELEVTLEIMKQCLMEVNPMTLLAQTIVKSLVNTSLLTSYDKSEIFILKAHTKGSKIPKRHDTLVFIEEAWRTITALESILQRPIVRSFNGAIMNSITRKRQFAAIERSKENLTKIEVMQMTNSMNTLKDVV